MPAVRWALLAAVPAALASKAVSPGCDPTAGDACRAPWGAAEAEAEAVEQEEAAAQDMRLLQARAPLVGRRGGEAVQPIWHYARDCLQPTPGMAVCNAPGMCERFCGPGNACCRKYSTTDPVECQGVTFFPVQGYHTCVRAAQAPTTEAPATTEAPTTEATTEAPSTTPRPPERIVCGDKVSSDCILDHDASVNTTGGVAQFCDRCIGETGDEPLRSRCKTCCEVC